MSWTTGGSSPPNYIARDGRALIRLWGTALADIATTYVHNPRARQKHPAWFERRP
jgi:hypothetical protein